MSEEQAITGIKEAELATTPKPEQIKNKTKRTFVVVNGTEETGTFHGNSPRVAALKVANTLSGTKENPVTFKIRERGTKKIHVFKGYSEQIPTPEKLKGFIKTPTMKHAHVEKLGMEAT